jgi:hypothetical protein
MRFYSRYAGLTLVMEPAKFGESPGRRIEFRNGEYMTDKKDEIKFIKANKGFGVYIFSDESAKTSTPAKQA